MTLSGSGGGTGFHGGQVDNGSEKQIWNEQFLIFLFYS